MIFRDEREQAFLRWVEALESGRYIQCFGTATRYDKGIGYSYCAVEVRHRVNAENNNNCVFGPHDSYVTYKGVKTSIVELNDFGKLPFREIAALIRAEHGLPPRDGEVIHLPPPEEAKPEPQPTARVKELEDA